LFVLWLKTGNNQVAKMKGENLITAGFPPVATILLCRHHKTSA
jgi:hypothetical protein